MAQYRIYTDGTTTWRRGVRSENFVTDVALTETGFSGTENVDWKNREIIEKPA